MVLRTRTNGKISLLFRLVKERQIRGTCGFPLCHPMSTVFSMKRVAIQI